MHSTAYRGLCNHASGGRVGQFLPQPSLVTATLDLLAGWRLQDATADLILIRAAEQEVAELKRAMNEIRADAGETVLYP